MRKVLILTMSILMVFLLISSIPSTSASPSESIESCDSAGITKDTFDPGESVYLKGSGLKPSWSYDIYIVVNYDPWLEDVTGLSVLTVVITILDVATDATGKFTGQPILIWSSADPGYYDIWADRATTFPGDGSRIYDAPDRIDDIDVGTAGFFVIPELPLGTVMAMVASFGALAGFGTKRSLRLKR